MDFKKIQTFIFFILLVGIGYLFLLMLWPYVMGVFWAAVIAALFHPLYVWIHKRVKKEQFSSLLSIVFILLIFALPLSAVLGITIQQARTFSEQITNPQTIERLQEYTQTVLDNETVHNTLTNPEFESRVKQAASTVGTKALQWVQAGSGNVLGVIINVFVMIYVLYYMFKDGPRWLQKLMRLIPLGDANEKILYERFVSTSRATLKGTLLIGGIQGTLGGVLFWVLGVPSAAFWGLVMIVLSIIPAAGPPLIWTPAVIYLFATGNIWQGVAMIIGGVLIGLTDNFLRPALVGKDIQMHPIIILLSTIGGLSLFGISGVVIGPMIAAFFLAFLQMYEAKYKKELNSSST